MASSNEERIIVLETRVGRIESDIESEKDTRLRVYRELTDMLVRFDTENKVRSDARDMKIEQLQRFQWMQFGGLVTFQALIGVALAIYLK